MHTTQLFCKEIHIPDIVFIVKIFIKIRKQTQKRQNYEIHCRSEDERDAAIQRVEELQEALDGIQKKSKERSKKVPLNCQCYLW